MKYWQLFVVLFCVSTVSEGMVQKVKKITKVPGLMKKMVCSLARKAIKKSKKEVGTNSTSSISDVSFYSEDSYESWEGSSSCEASTSYLSGSEDSLSSSSGPSGRLRVIVYRRPESGSFNHDEERVISSFSESSDCSDSEDPLDDSEMAFQEQLKEIARHSTTNKPHPHTIDESQDFALAVRLQFQELIGTSHNPCGGYEADDVHIRGEKPKERKKARARTRKKEDIDDTCLICYDAKGKELLCCKKKFICTKCLHGWLARKKTCPFCIKDLHYKA